MPTMILVTKLMMMVMMIVMTLLMSLMVQGNVAMQQGQTCEYTVPTSLRDEVLVIGEWIKSMTPEGLLDFYPPNHLALHYYCY